MVGGQKPKGHIDKLAILALVSGLTVLGGQNKHVPEIQPTDEDYAVMIKASEKRARKNAKRLREIR